MFLSRRALRGHLHIQITSGPVRRLFSSTSSYEYIQVETHADGKVGLVRLNRPKALNALCGPLISEVNAALTEFDNNKNVGCMVLTGNEKAFAGIEISHCCLLNLRSWS